MLSESLIAASDNDDERYAWRQALPEGLCRELASEFIMQGGEKATNPEFIDPIYLDAYIEYQQRYGAKDRSDNRGARGNKRKRRNSRYR